jgi:hypothetical protein
VSSQRLSYSVGFTLPVGFADMLKLIPDRVWAPAVDADGGIRDGAYAAEVTDLLTCPPGRRACG